MIKMLDPDDCVDNVLFVTRGRFKGRICYCDDFEQRTLIVTFGHCLLKGMRSYDIKVSFVRLATTNDLVVRLEDLRTQLMRRNFNSDYEWLSEHESDYLYEIDLISSELWSRDSMARFTRVKSGKRIYLAHSSLDKGYVRRLHTDLANLGHNPWLDELEIKVGESIVQKLNEAISTSDFLVLVMSENAAKSKWVQSEWQTKYWSEVNSGTIKVLVAVIDNVELPDFLMIKKYADFRESYEKGLHDLLIGIGHPTRDVQAE